VKPIEKILSLLSVIPLTLIPISCDEMNIYTGPWQEVPTPGGEGYLKACYFNSPNDGWAVGHDGTGQGKMIFMHWNGVEWEEYEYPGWFDAYGTVTSTDIADVFFTSPNDGWAVGFVGFENDDYYGFVLRHDGNDWYLFETEVSFYKIYGISEDDVWFLTGSNNSDLYHWNGMEFEYYNLYPGNYGLRDIALGSTNEGLAVGDYKFVYHWDGISWDLITYGFGGEYSCVAYDTPTTAFIGGDNLARWDDGEYHRDYDYNGTYNGIHFSSPDEGWMHGGEPTEENPQGEGFFWHWDGVEWERSKAPDFMNPKAVFSVNYDDAWMVGMGWNASCQSWRYVID